MTALQAVVLGIIQGLSEFIPISSTAHLTLAGKLMGLIDPANPEKWTAFIGIIQLGTLAAVLIYFARDIVEIIKAFFSENLGSHRKPLRQQGLMSRLGWFIIAGSVPIFVVGMGLKDLIEGSLTKDLLVISISLIGLAVLLGIAEVVAKHRKGIEQITLKDALIVGFAQCLALIPGASRSGTTITAGLFSGLRRDTAAKFSFLLSIPAVFGSGLLEFYQSLKYTNSSEMMTLVVATLASAISGYIAIAFLIKYLQKHSTFIFIVYRIALGLAIILFFI